MEGKILPIDFPGLDERIYAGFWRRFGAFWLDVLIVAPVMFALIYFNNLDRMNAIYAYLPSISFSTSIISIL